MTTKHNMQHHSSKSDSDFSVAHPKYSDTVSEFLDLVARLIARKHICHSNYAACNTDVRGTANNDD